MDKSGEASTWWKSDRKRQGTGSNDPFYGHDTARDNDGGKGLRNISSLTGEHPKGHYKTNKKGDQTK